MAANSESIADLYVEHHSWLKGLLRKKLGCSDAASDLAQDTFIRLLGASSAPKILEPRKYLATIANALVVDRFRRKAIEAAYLETLAARPEPLAISPEERAMILETLVAIDRMLDELGARTRQIFMLAQFDGLTYAQIGMQLGVSVTTVKNHMVRALTRCLELAET